jgi:hypothetical protein
VPIVEAVKCINPVVDRCFSMLCFLYLPEHLRTYVLAVSNGHVWLSGRAGKSFPCDGDS